MATNQYLAFGVGVGANTLTPASYAGSPLISLGHQPGVALSEVANTTWRQTSVSSAGLAQLVVDVVGTDMLDDGSVTNFKNGVKAAIEQLIASQQFWHPGDIKGTLGGVPQGWMPCDGRALSRTSYAALFAAIGTTYGAGDGSTTFLVPDLRGEFLRGWDASRGVDPGRTLGSAQAESLKEHSHPLRVGTSDGSAGYVNFGLQSIGNGAYRSPPSEPFSAATGGAETRPRNVAVYWLIKT